MYYYYFIISYTFRILLDSHFCFEFWQLDRNVRNKFGETALDVLCSRVNKPSAAQKEKIRALLENQYYVRLLRSDDNTAKIAPPWSPNVSCDYETVESAIRGTSPPGLAGSYYQR